MSEALPTLWFVLIAVLWAGYLFLEGFDLGVGMLMKLMARNDTQRRVLLNTVGPVWDGNEVWLVTAVGATFAAFPLWYASLLSALYLPFLLVLLGLIFRAVAFEWRGKQDSDAWRNRWDWAIALGSFAAAAGIGAALALTTTGLPLDANGDRVGGAFAWATAPAFLGAAAVVLFCLVHAAAFIALKTEGGVRAQADRLFRRLLPIAMLPFLGWALLVQLDAGSAVTWLAVALAIAALTASYRSALSGRDGRAFAALGVGMLALVGSVFAAVFPVVLPSTVDPAFDLTVSNASSSPYTLGVMSVVACFGLPLVLAYQAWTYWVFRRRVSEASIPAAHGVTAL
ncbi:cytochrome d ubiquinol oxidase subunit II [Arthrobacter agilis]|nr:cytochrome d ubiquinol oxidase subunit II [Arthrobacter agilis]OUM45070.1 cytochrome d ubiquinol oxidase subunit II [Arthrobacter agilis]PPB47036.1 cytochrome d ubiquinol oxidase subunit II [Arthrobacter agilis]TPV23464.1 cytochrome d ubiquinol oxidase subunit II [Arthrobacter agilis]WDF34593.1 cytochrome d ubiquinol oxidase subunit II [Arthrobacter agilis]